MPHRRLTRVTTPRTAVSSQDSRASEGSGGGGCPPRGGGGGWCPAAGGGAASGGTGRAPRVRGGSGPPAREPAPPWRQGSEKTCLPLDADARAGTLRADGDRRDRLGDVDGRLVLGGAPLGQPG